MSDHGYTPSRIWNMDETGVSTVQKPGKIVATKGLRLIGKVTSGERGQTVTAICGMNAAGMYIPPMFIFPRKRMVDSLMNGSPPQSVGYCSANGWTDSSLFLQWLQHFQKCTNASIAAQQIIILDGHHSHKTLAAVEYARENGIHLITLPPHCTHKLQPLDRTFFKPLKSAYNAVADSWMTANPGRRISQYEIAGIFSKAYLQSATPDKAIKGFSCTGLWPINEDIFTDEDFASASVTDDPMPVADISHSPAYADCLRPGPSADVGPRVATTFPADCLRPGPSTDVGPRVATTFPADCLRPGPSAVVGPRVATTFPADCLRPGPSADVGPRIATTFPADWLRPGPSADVGPRVATTFPSDCLRPGPSADVGPRVATTFPADCLRPGPSADVGPRVATTFPADCLRPGPSADVGPRVATTFPADCLRPGPSADVGPRVATTFPADCLRPGPSADVGPSAETLDCPSSQTKGTICINSFYPSYEKLFCFFP